LDIKVWFCGFVGSKSGGFGEAGRRAKGKKEKKVEKGEYLREAEVMGGKRWKTLPRRPPRNWMKEFFLQGTR
jgi:hypothetical protein